MKVLIVYYSKTNNTARVAEALKEEFKRQGDTVSIERIYPEEEHNGGYWFLYKTFKDRCPIKPPNIIDVSDYDIVCIGTPNWSKLSPPVAEYLAQAQGMKYKRVGIFVTTALAPWFEWYVFSAYFLDITTQHWIEIKKARRTDTLLLSSVVKNWSISSNRGKTMLHEFCQKLRSPIESLKTFTLEQKESDSTRLLIILLATIIIISAILQCIFTINNVVYFTFMQFAYITAAATSLLLILLLIMSNSRYIYTAKYLSGISLSILWTIVIIFNPLFRQQAIIGYIIILAMISIYRDRFAIFVSGVTTVIGYGYLLTSNIFHFNTVSYWNILYVFLAASIMYIITNNLQKHYVSLLETQEDLEIAGKALVTQLSELEKAKQALERESRKTETIINNLSDGLLVLNAQNIITLINPIAQSLFETEQSAVTGKTLDACDGVKDFHLLSEIIDQHTVQKEIRLGNNHTVEVTVAEVQDKQQKMKLLLLHDITEARALEVMKVDFASIAAHELRTPITTLRGYLSLLTQKPEENTEEEKQLYLNRAVISSERLSSLIDSLLAVTRVEKGQAILTLEPLSLEEIINEAVTDQIQIAEAKRQRLFFIPPEKQLPKVKADKLKLKEIINNLITNAVRYTQEGGEITISTTNKEKLVEVHVKDNGEGIPKELQPHLFTKFLRGEDPLRKETKGVGLGLYLVKSLVELQGGSIWLQSEPGLGTKFSFSLPVDITV